MKILFNCVDLYYTPRALFSLSPLFLINCSRALHFHFLQKIKWSRLYGEGNEPISEAVGEKKEPRGSPTQLLHLPTLD